MPEYMWSEDEEQPKDHVNDGNASKQSRYCPLDVMENGQEPQVFVVEDLLLVWRCCFHEQEITRAVQRRHPKPRNKKPKPTPLPPLRLKITDPRKRPTKQPKPLKQGSRNIIIRDPTLLQNVRGPLLLWLYWLFIGGLEGGSDRHVGGCGGLLGRSPCLTIPANSNSGSALAACPPALRPRLAWWQPLVWRWLVISGWVGSRLVNVSLLVCHPPARH